MDEPEAQQGETYNPWSIVNVVFHHLATQGLHPVLGEAGDPGAPAADLLRALGIEPRRKVTATSPRTSSSISPSSVMPYLATADHDLATADHRAGGMTCGIRPPPCLMLRAHKHC